MHARVSDQLQALQTRSRSKMTASVLLVQTVKPNSFFVVQKNNTYEFNCSYKRLIRINIGFFKISKLVHFIGYSWLLIGATVIAQVCLDNMASCHSSFTSSSIARRPNSSQHFAEHPLPPSATPIFRPGMRSMKGRPVVVRTVTQLSV